MRKMQIRINATIMPKLLYSLSAAWLNAAERRRLDGAHARMLRAIAGIKHSMISRVSNSEVRRRTGQILATDMLLKHQLALYFRAARSCDGDPLRDSVFCPGTLTLVTDTFVGTLGAPRLEWAKQLPPHAGRFLRRA